MSKAQMIGWITAAGAAAGIGLAYVAMKQVGADIDSGEALPNPYDFLLCPPLILVLILPTGISRLSAQSIIYLFNAAVFAFPLFIVGAIASIFTRRATKPQEASNG